MNVKKKAIEVYPGDVIVAPGSELHHDLAGLEVQLTVVSVKRRGEFVIFTTDDPAEVIWRRDETVSVVSRRLPEFCANCIDSRATTVRWRDDRAFAVCDACARRPLNGPPGRPPDASAVPAPRSALPAADEQPRAAMLRRFRS